MTPLYGEDPWYVTGITNFAVAFLSSVMVFKKVKSQPAFNCSNLTIETLEQGVKYVQS